MTDATHRDFLAIPDFTRAELLALFDLAERMRRGEYREKPLAGKTLAMIFAKASTRTRVSFEVGTYPAGRPRALPVAARHPARPRRADRRHRARALALRRRHHDPHLRPPGRRGARALRERPGHQRAHRPAASLPGARRPAHRAAAPRRLSRGRPSPGSATATTWPTPGSTPRTASASTSRSPARRATSPPTICSSARGRTRTSRVTRDPQEAVRGRATSSTPTSGPRMGQEEEQKKRERASPATPWTSGMMAARATDGDLPALPPGAPRRGGHRRRDRRAAVPRLGRGREPAARAEGDHGGADGWRSA